MCLYPRLIKNRRYQQNKKNGGIIPPVFDERTLYVPIGCGECIECRKQKARNWQVRLEEDIKENKNGKFVTLTFSNESIKELDTIIPHQTTKERQNWNGEKIKKEITIEGYTRDNAIATKGVRLFLERWRKLEKKSCRHWLVTELGHNGTENIHLHGILWTNKTKEQIEKLWKYGYIWAGNERNGKTDNYVNSKTIAYIVKYINKTDKHHRAYNSIVLTSNGIGKNYTDQNKTAWQENKYTPNKTKDTYRTTTGHKITLPTYYRNKIYSEEEKEKLWLEKLNKEERWVLGQKISIKNNDEEYIRALKEAQKTNKELGYSNPITKWAREKYENERRKLMQLTRINNAKK